MKKAVLFDLDGTLLPIDTIKFANDYISGIAQSVSSVIPSDAIKEHIWHSTIYMIKTNMQGITNKELFETELYKYTNKSWEEMSNYVQYFFDNGLDIILQGYKSDIRAKKVVSRVRERGMKCILATNPIFPQQVTYKRILCAGLEIEDFDYITTYENTYYTKPHLEYYKEIARHCGVEPESCLMIGNDVQDDLVARNIGMKVFWATDYALNRLKKGQQEKEEPVYDGSGSFDEMLSFVEEF